MSELKREMTDDSERNANARASVLKIGMNELLQAPSIVSCLGRSLKYASRFK